eukprot:TRINITY_DN121404_c0_g1_i1.p1 TRINITY_DN121404_c0_g1~~TRINITY_DN121404_c0_g1_i1.p1  ORF type:complete len:299 (-),score=108.63 TRINITY_DN121404_c0_g1_i1:99-995(-)
MRSLCDKMDVPSAWSCWSARVGGSGLEAVDENADEASVVIDLKTTESVAGIGDVMARISTVEKKLFKELADVKALAQKLQKEQGSTSQPALSNGSAASAVKSVSTKRPALPEGFLQDEMQSVELMAAQVRQQSLPSPEQLAQTLDEFVLCVKHSVSKVQQQVMQEVMEQQSVALQTAMAKAVNDAVTCVKEGTPPPEPVLLPKGPDPEVMTSLQKQMLINDSIIMKIKASSLHASIFTLKCLHSEMTEDHRQHALDSLQKKHKSVQDQLAAMDAKMSGKAGQAALRDVGDEEIDKEVA